MKRDLMFRQVEWKNDLDRKPLLNSFPEEEGEEEGTGRGCVTCVTSLLPYLRFFPDHVKK